MIISLIKKNISSRIIVTIQAALLIWTAWSCNKDDGPSSFDFSISGIEPVNSFIEETVTLRLTVDCNNISPEDVYLTLEDVPDGVTCTLDKESGIPEFAVNMEIKVSKSATGGNHIIKLIGSSSSRIREFDLSLTIDKSLSASFTVYNATTYNPDNINSNLLEGALVKLYRSVAAYDSGKVTYQEETQSDGKAYFYKIPEGLYLYTIEKDTLSNIVQKRQIDGIMKGFIVAGLFRSSSEIVNSAQPKAKIGDLKFRDLNGDNQITTADLGIYDNLSIYDGELNEKVIWIGK